MRSVINRSIRPGIGLRAVPVGHLKADTWPDIRVDTRLSTSFNVCLIFITSSTILMNNYEHLTRTQFPAGMLDSD